MSTTKARPLFDPPIVRRAVVDSFKKLDPRRQIRNPVMFTVFIGSILTTGLGIHALSTPPLEGGAWGGESAAFILHISAWLWFTVLFANFAEAMAEGRGKAQADSLRQARRDVVTKKLVDLDYRPSSTSQKNEKAYASLSAALLRNDDVARVEAGETYPADGQLNARR